MALPHYLRFARAIALVSAASGCGGSVTETATADGGTDTLVADATPDTSKEDGTPPDTTAPDTFTPDTSKPDTSKPDTFDAATNGTCLTWAAAVSCAAGKTCQFGGAGDGTCGDAPDGSSATPCGVISCASPCFCENAEASVCNCKIAVGPLAPPDLPTS